MLFKKKKAEEPPAPQEKAAPVQTVTDPFSIARITMQDPDKGSNLLASWNGEHIIMETSWTEADPTPDGTNAYMFANKLIVVPRWSNLSGAEQEPLRTSPLTLAIYPHEFVQFSLRIGQGWEDVFFNLPNCISGFNFPDAPVEEMIFIGCDPQDSSFLAVRRIALPPVIQKILAQSNAACLKKLDLDSDPKVARYKENAAKLKAELAENPASAGRQLFYTALWILCDELYDRCYKITGGIGQRVRSFDPDDIPSGIYMEISSQDQVMDLSQNK